MLRLLTPVAAAATVFALAAATLPAPSTAPATHVVRMTGNDFVPRRVVASAGDTIRWVNGPGGPHNVAFWPDSLPPGTRDRVARAMPDSIAPLIGSLVLDEGQTWTMVLSGLPAGRYPYYCLPHVVGGMVGEFEIR